MKVNGEFINLEHPTNLNTYLNLSGYQLSNVAVEKNGEIVPKNRYETTELNNEDTIEVVSFVGGG